MRAARSSRSEEVVPASGTEWYRVRGSAITNIATTITATATNLRTGDADKNAIYYSDSGCSTVVTLHASATDRLATLWAA